MAWCDVVEPRTLRACRIELGQSQAAFAATLGSSPESYRTWDAGRRAPPPKVLARARALATHQDDLLGRACGSSSISFESSLRLIELMRQLNTAQTDPLQVLGIVQVLSEMDALYTPVMKRGHSESVHASEAMQRFGHSVVEGLQRYCRDEFEFWARCKRASLLRDWIEGTPVDELERRYSTTPYRGAISYGAAKLSARKRKQIARKAAATRWKQR